MEDTSPAEPSSQHQQFTAARRNAGWTLEQLWIHYIALGGTLVVFDLDAYLAGLTPIPPDQQDVLACALNERLADLHQTTRIPYLSALANPPDQDAVTELLEQLPDLNSPD
jgi:hypothetical protein